MIVQTVVHVVEQSCFEKVVSIVSLSACLLAIFCPESLDTFPELSCSLVLAIAAVLYLFTFS